MEEEVAEGAFHLGEDEARLAVVPTKSQQNYQNMQNMPCKYEVMKLVFLNQFLY